MTNPLLIHFDCLFENKILHSKYKSKITLFH